MSLIDLRLPLMKISAMDGVTRIGDHFLDENEGYESDQLRDDYAENQVPEPLATQKKNVPSPTPKLGVVSVFDFRPVAKLIPVLVGSPRFFVV